MNFMQFIFIKDPCGKGLTAIVFDPYGKGLTAIIFDIIGSPL